MEITEINEHLVSIVERNLPPLPGTIAELRDYINQDPHKIEIKGIVDIISKDPISTANLLKIANSPYYGFSSRITTIAQAITLLGIENTKNVIMADSVRSMFKVDVSPYGLDTASFLANSAKEADFISKWLSAEDGQLAQTLIPCAMLLRLGMILFSSVLIKIKKDKQFLEAIKESKYQNIALIEQEFFGMDHISFLAYCFDHWKFDDALTEIVVYATNPHSAPEDIKKGAYALAIANRIFGPYEGGNDYNTKEAELLLQEAVKQGVSFNLENLVERIAEVKQGK